MRHYVGKWLNAMLVAEYRGQVCPGPVAPALVAAVLVAMVIGSASTAEAQADPRAATATTVDSTRISGPVGSIVLENDFTRLIFVKTTVPSVTNLGKTNSVYQGKLVQAREFVSATVLYRPPLPAIVDARFVGGDVFSNQDLVAMRCRPSNPGTLQATVASWPNVFAEATSDLADLMGYTPTDCPTKNLDSSFPVDQRVYCASENFSDEEKVMVPIALQNAVDTGATVFQFTGTPFLANPNTTTGANVLFDLYGIGSGFSGLGYSVADSFIQGANVALTANQSLEQSVVTEYLALNVPLAAANCRCVRVAPYDGRDTSPLDWNRVWSKGKLASDGSCVKRARLP